MFKFDKKNSTLSYICGNMMQLESIFRDFKTNYYKTIQNLKTENYLGKELKAYLEKSCNNINDIELEAIIHCFGVICTIFSKKCSLLKYTEDKSTEDLIKVICLLYICICFILVAPLGFGLLPIVGHIAGTTVAVACFTLCVVKGAKRGSSFV